MAKREKYTRTILHIDMDAFFVAVERRRDPSLQGRPVIVGGDPEERGVVSSASYEARAYGVHAGMPLVTARMLCPHAVFIRCNHPLYAEASREVFEIIGRFSPLVERVSIDEAYVDLTGTDRLFGPAVQVAEMMHRDIRDKLSFPSSIGIGTNKLVAKVASSLAKPEGLIYVYPGREASFLAPLPVKRLPGVGKAVEKKLLMVNIRTIGQLASTDEKLLRRLLGVAGHILHERAKGIDPNPVIPVDPLPKSIGHEVTFPEDTSDKEYIKSVLHMLTGLVTRRMRRHRIQARTVTLKIRYADFVTQTRCTTFPHPTDLDSSICPVLQHLLQKLYTRRMALRLVGISLSNLIPAPQQEDLFSRRLHRMYKSMDLIRDRYGFDAIMPGCTTLAKGMVEHLPSKTPVSGINKVALCEKLSGLKLSA